MPICDKRIYTGADCISFTTDEMAFSTTINTVTINTVPNEILISVLSTLPTHSLLPLVAVSRRFCSVILRILRQRLRRAASLPDHCLILECYHPSAKLSTPYLYCDYLYTDGLEPSSPSSSPPREPADGSAAIPTLGMMYSHFRPVAQDENRRARRRYPRQAAAAAAALHSECPSQDIFLDETELFSQLCTVTNLVKMGPRPGLFLSHVNVGEGVMRVWRGWLAANAADAGTADASLKAPILWADASQDVGVRFRVTERREVGELDPVLLAVDDVDEVPVAYRLEFEELVVRAGRLLLSVEHSEVQEVTTSGKAIVIALV
ncbi:hypothetical protein B0T25DRAFT_210479 [Lasiosphaeria hispida]|uniref:F-box domain-containing protein n=1 Tax=Lasiosphaeria hispida TaxID=260671 RepID=A0AAJ0MEF0_9PEZI|nr:hypothetical protein B0T25DRAFT_210479 [Lasiosphaeria hispida]